jgi:hypothetical protein
VKAYGIYIYLSISGTYNIDHGYLLILGNIERRVVLSMLIQTLALILNILTKVKKLSRNVA